MIRIGKNSLLSMAALGVLASGCGPGTSKNETIPTLPGDGDANVAKPTAPTAPAKPKTPADPWAGRDDLITTPAAKAPSAVKLPTVTRFTLKNGLKVLVIENHELPVVSMQLAIKAGRQDETRGKTGVAQFTAAMLTSGTRKRSRAKIADQIDFVGGTLVGQSRYEASLVSCSTLSQHTSTCLKLLPDVILRPTFPKKEIETVREQMQTVVKQRKDNAGSLAAAHFQNALWGDDNVRGWPLSAASISAIKRKDLVAWHKRWYKPNNALLAVAGDVDAKKLEKQLNRAFRGWRRGKLPKRKTYKEPELRGVTVRLVDKPSQTQAHIRIGHLGIAHRDADFYATLVFNYTLGGGGFSSRLMKVVRSEGGKTYGARSGYERNLTRGSFIASTFTRTKETFPTIKLMLQEIGKMAKSGPTQAEVSDAITNIAGRYSTQFESAASIAGALLSAELHGFDDDYVRSFALNIAKVTPAEAQKAAAKHLDPRNFVIVVVGDAKELEPQLKKTRLPYEKIFYLDPIAAFERVQEKMKPVDPKRAAKARKILNAALAAKGGKSKLRGVKTLTLEGTATLSMGGRTVPATVKRYFVRPRQMRLDMSIANGMVTVTTTLNKTEGWVRQARGGKAMLKELSGSELGMMTSQLWRDQEFVLLRHLDKGTIIAPAKGEKIDGTMHKAVTVTRADGKSSVTLYFSPKTKLLRRMTYKERGTQTVEDYSNYKTVSGIKFAHSRKTKGAGGGFDVTVTKVSTNAKVDPKLFVQPKQAKKADPPKTGK